VLAELLYDKRADTVRGRTRPMLPEDQRRMMLQLADLLEKEGVVSQDIVAHCREPGEHVRACARMLGR